MAFRKAKAEQAFIKASIYGSQGTGKTFTALLMAEGLAKVVKKRVAVVDTEHGTDFYAKKVPQREIHPEAFDFDAIYTASIFQIMNDVKALNPAEYGVIILDSMTHIWEACRAAYAGRMGKSGQIPLHAWGSIKRPYKELMAFLISSPYHVFFLGRQGGEFGEDEETGEMKKLGDKMKAEGETQYEPHICIQMLSERGKDRVIPCAYFEKDRSGIFAYKSIYWPNFENVCKPILEILGGTQAQMSTMEEVGGADAEAYATIEAKKVKESTLLLREWSARIELARNSNELNEVSKGISKEVKARMTSDDVATLRGRWALRDAELKPSDSESLAPAPEVEKELEKVETPVDPPVEKKTRKKKEPEPEVAPSQTVRDQLQEESEKPKVENSPGITVNSEEPKCRACLGSGLNSKKTAPCPICSPKDFSEKPAEPLKNQAESKGPPVQILEATFEKPPTPLGKGNFKYVTSENEIYYSNATGVKSVVDANIGVKISIGVQEIESRMVIVSARQIA